MFFSCLGTVQFVYKEQDQEEGKGLRQQRRVSGRNCGVLHIFWARLPRRLLSMMNVQSFPALRPLKQVFFPAA